MEILKRYFHSIRDERGAILLIFASFVVKEIWTLLPRPYDETLRQFFPFSDQTITTVTHISYFCYYGSMILLCAAFSLLFKRFPITMVTWRYMVFAEFIEYFLNYNEVWFQVPIVFFTLNVNITNLKYLSLFCTITTELITWKR